MALATAVRVSNATVAIVLPRALHRACVARCARLRGGGFRAGDDRGGLLVTRELVVPQPPVGGSAERPLSWHYIVRSWRDSTVFDWKMLVILLPLPILGAVRASTPLGHARRARGHVLSTALFYSLYYITALHPRFLYVALPALFILAGLGVQLLVGRFGPRAA